MLILLEFLASARRTVFGGHRKGVGSGIRTKKELEAIIRLILTV
jgi:hypothetical protein